MRLLFPYLALFGTIPFIFCASFLFMGIDVIEINNLPLLSIHNTEPLAINQILSVYGLIIASFMAGSHWGNHLHIVASNLNSNLNSQTKSRQYLLRDWANRLPLISNGIVIGLWLGFLIQPVKDFYVLLLMSFFIMLVIDISLQNCGIISKVYFKVRCLVTAIVNLSLIFAIISV